MDLLLILTYAAVCIASFKIFKIPRNKWTIPSAVLGGIFIIGSLITIMNYNHPYAEMARGYYISTPIVPLVKGRVEHVYVHSNQDVKKGDLLFTIEKEPFLQRVNSEQSRFKSSKEYTLSILARLKAAEQDLVRYNELSRRGLGIQRDLDLSRANVDDLSAQLSQQIENNKEIDAQLKIAKYELAQTDIYAPSDGHVIQLALMPGMIATPHLYRPVMTFIHKSQTYFVGWFWQNSMQRLKVGDDAEVVIDGAPGKIFSGKVSSIITALSSGNIQANMPIIDESTAINPGRLSIVIKITDPEWSKYQVIDGASGQVAIYTENFEHISIMRKVLLRMASWLNYLFPFH